MTVDNKLVDSGVVYFIERKYFQGDDIDEPAYWLFYEKIHRDAYMRDIVVSDCEEMDIDTSGKDLESMVKELNYREQDYSVLSRGQFTVCTYTGINAVSELRESSHVDDLCRVTRSLISALRSKRVNDGDRMRIAEAEAVIRAMEES